MLDPERATYEDELTAFVYGTSSGPYSPATGPVALRALADRYTRSHGLLGRPWGKQPVDPEFGRRTAEAYEAMPKVDEDARPAYAAFVDETDAQYGAIVASGIVDIQPTLDDPYRSSAEMFEDVERGRLLVYAGDADHPFMTDEQNVRFRAVHDLFAHAAERNQFGPKGELNAAIRHAAMYTPLARRALLAETHGQNSWVNYHPKAAANRERPGTVYAEQKASLLPEPIVREFEERYL